MPFHTVELDDGWYYAIGDDVDYRGPYGCEVQARNHARIEALGRL